MNEQAYSLCFSLKKKRVNAVYSENIKITKVTKMYT